MAELSLGVTAAGDRRVGQRLGARRQLGDLLGADDLSGGLVGRERGLLADKSLAGGRGHHDREVLDLANAAIGVHQLLGPDHDVLVVPAESDEQVAVNRGGGRHEVSGFVGMQCEGLLHQHVRARLERRFRLLVMPAHGAGNHDDVGFGVQDSGIVGVGRGEAEARAHTLGHVRVPPVDGHELHGIPMVRQAG